MNITNIHFSMVFILYMRQMYNSKDKISGLFKLGLQMIIPPISSWSYYNLASVKVVDVTMLLIT